MKQEFAFPCGNEIMLEHNDDIAFPAEVHLMDAIGMFFHYIQQQYGCLYLNGQRIFALSMAQTCGGPAAPCDYVGLDNNPTTKVATIESLLK